jgi:hypothetical protein
MHPERDESKSMASTRRGRAGADRSAAIRTANADARAQQLVPALTVAWKAGATTYRQMARALVTAGVPAPRGGIWTAMAVKRVLDRLGAE